ncbi:MAG TPA: hypothetical protein VII48_06990 [Rhizomicrobium sp.]
MPSEITPHLALVWAAFFLIGGFCWTAGCWLWGRLITGFRRAP